MTFDFVSFAIGLVAGGLVGILAMYLHETETIGELQERVRIATLQFDRNMRASRTEAGDQIAQGDLHKQLLELQDEIKRLYRRAER